MATRGAIARLKRLTPLEFAGRYHHWDSYPTELGRTLWSLYHGHFEKNLEQMLKVLLDEHPAGWSSLHDADFRLEPGFGDAPGRKQQEEGSRPQCYCHGDRNEEGWAVNQENAAGSGVEWAYAFSTIQTLARQELHSLLILASYREDDRKMIGMFGQGDPDAVWKSVAVVEMQGSEPDWEHIQERARHGSELETLPVDSVPDDCDAPTVAIA